MITLALYKLVVRDKNGKVIQSHELHWSNNGFCIIIHDAADKGYSVTVTKL